MKNILVFNINDKFVFDNGNNNAMFNAKFDKDFAKKGPPK